MPPNPNTALLTPHMSHLTGHSTLGDSFYKNERNRLDSFGGFQNTFVDVGKLAAAGFYYTKTNDVVRCAFCKIEIGNWEQGDDPLSEHKRWRANCPFLTGQEVGNMPINSRNSSSPVDTSRGVDECGLYGITPVDPLINVGPLERLGITKHSRPQHSAFMNLAERLKSFETWPMALQPRPEALATAGFFYTGHSDRCVCFQCGGGLKDWSDSDDPWVEHAKFFPNCTYVLRSKGETFVASCRTESTPNPPSGSTQTQASTPATNTETIVTSESTSCSSERSESPLAETTEKKEDRKENTESPESGTKDETKEGAAAEVLSCKICYLKEMSVAFLPCGHVVACAKCAPSLQHCAVCRKRVTATFRVYLA